MIAFLILYSFLITYGIQLIILQMLLSMGKFIADWTLLPYICYPFVFLFHIYKVIMKKLEELKLQKLKREYITEANNFL
jgi:hypothetical protein